jgi:hypothetical protein
MIWRGSLCYAWGGRNEAEESNSGVDYYVDWVLVIHSDGILEVEMNLIYRACDKCYPENNGELGVIVHCDSAHKLHIIIPKVLCPKCKLELQLLGELR